MTIDSLIRYGTPICEMPFEIVEIKGRGHPDTICDLICDYVSARLLRYYETQCGRLLHYNIDKALLVGGVASPRFGGGTIVEPAALYLGDRATETLNERQLNVRGLVRDSVASWLGENLRFLRLGSNLQLHEEIRPSSESLSAVEQRRVSNDTSVGVGSWPPTPLEDALLALEGYLNSTEFKTRHPETGEDIKIMATREGNHVNLICAIAMVDRFVSSVSDYFEKKRAIGTEIGLYLSQSKNKMRFSVEVNCLDTADCNEAGLYLTVTGLSCEHADSGQVGRGNRVNGVISFLRPQTMEAWAGKNPISHVGKIYSFAAKSLAKAICQSLSEARQADVFIVGQIGSPVIRPADVFSDVVVPGGCDRSSLREEVNRVIVREIDRAETFRVRI